MNVFLAGLNSSHILLLRIRCLKSKLMRVHFLASECELRQFQLFPVVSIWLLVSQQSAGGCMSELI